MKLINFIILVLITFISFSQNKTLIIGGRFDNHNYSFSCPKYTYSQNAILNFKLDPQILNNIVFTENEIKKVQKKAEEIINDTCGNGFLEHLKFYNIDIIYWDSINSLKNINIKVDSNICSKTKYLIRYDFIQDKDTLYRLGIAFDDKLNKISPINLPNKMNKDFFKIIRYQSAIDIARKTSFSLSKKSDHIYLILNKKENKFEYVFTGLRSFHSFYYYKLKKVLIDAVTGKILNSEFTNYISIRGL